MAAARDDRSVSVRKGTRGIRVGHRSGEWNAARDWNDQRRARPRRGCARCDDEVWDRVAFQGVRARRTCRDVSGVPAHAAGAVAGAVGRRRTIRACQPRRLSPRTFPSASPPTHGRSARHDFPPVVPHTALRPAFGHGGRRRPRRAGRRSGWGCTGDRVSPTLRTRRRARSPRATAGRGSPASRGHLWGGRNRQDRAGRRTRSTGAPPGTPDSVGHLSAMRLWPRCPTADHG